MGVRVIRAEFLHAVHKWVSKVNFHVKTNKRAMALYTCVDKGNKCADFGRSEATTASEVKSDLRFEISDPNYLLIHVHTVDMVYALFDSL